MKYLLQLPVLITVGLLFASCGNDHGGKETSVPAPSTPLTVSEPAAVTSNTSPSAPAPATPDVTIKSYHLTLGWPSNTVMKNSIVLGTGEAFTLNEAANQSERIDVIAEARYNEAPGLFAPTALESTKGWVRRKGSRVSGGPISGYSRTAFDAVGNAAQIHALG